MKKIEAAIFDMDGIVMDSEPFLENSRRKGYKIGLATNSPACLIDTVSKKLRIHSLFDAISSAEYEAKGKPDPAVYLSITINVYIV